MIQLRLLLLVGLLLALARAAALAGNVVVEGLHQEKAVIDPSGSPGTYVLVVFLLADVVLGRSTCLDPYHRYSYDPIYGMYNHVPKPVPAVYESQHTPLDAAAARRLQSAVLEEMAKSQEGGAENNDGPHPLSGTDRQHFYAACPFFDHLMNASWGCPYIGSARARLCVSASVARAFS